MAGLTVWGLRRYHLSNLPQHAKVPHLVIPLVALTCITVLWVNRDKIPPVGVLSAIVLLGFAVVGFFASPRSLSDFLYWSDQIVRTNREKWEVVALCTTAFMAIIYLDSLEQLKKYFQQEDATLNLIVMPLFGSAVMIAISLYLLHDLFWHYASVVAVAGIFLFCDWRLWRTLCNSQDNEARRYAKDARALLAVLDVPVFVALLILLLFIATLGCDPTYLDKIVPNHTTYDIALQDSCVEASPFMAGAIAFQMIAFNVMYVAFALRLHEELDLVPQK